MADQRVPVLRTTPSRLDFARALLRVWRADAGIVPSKAAAGVLWAHFAGETGDGAKCWNWNLGNWKHVKGSGHTFMALSGVWEGLRYGDEDGDGDVDVDDRVMFIARMVRSGLWREDPSADHARAVGARKVSMVATPINATCFFRAYASLEVGMAAFVGHKRNPKSRYASALPLIEAGNPDGYARELGRKGYYTADPNVYARAMRRKHAEWMAATAYDEALAKMLAASEAATEPRLPVEDEVPSPPPALVDWAIIRGAVPLDRPALDRFDADEW